MSKETAEWQKKKNGQVPTLKQKETGNCVKVQAIVVGPVTTRVVIALWDLLREVHSLRWVVGLSFRLSAAIPKSSFLSEVHNHPFEPGELKKIGKLCGEMSFKKKRLVNDCVFFRKLLVEQCRILEPIAADQALLRNFSAGLLRFRSIFSAAIVANVAVLTAVLHGGGGGGRAMRCAFPFF